MPISPSVYCSHLWGVGLWAGRFGRGLGIRWPGQTAPLIRTSFLMYLWVGRDRVLSCHQLWERMWCLNRSWKVEWSNPWSGNKTGKQKHWDVNWHYSAPLVHHLVTIESTCSHWIFCMHSFDNSPLVWFAEYPCADLFPPLFCYWLRAALHLCFQGGTVVAELKSVK